MRPPRLAPTIALALLLGAGVSCAGHRSVAPVPAPASPEARTRLAVLPLEDLSGQSGAADRMTRVLFTALAQSGAYEVLEPGAVDVALSEARVRSTGMLSREQIQSLANQLDTRWLLTGSALEFGQVRTPDGEVPAVGIALRLIDGHTGRVRWADQRYRSGDDRETVFGWGHESDADRLAMTTLHDLIRELRIPADDTTATSREARP